MSKKKLILGLVTAIAVVVFGYEQVQHGTQSDANPVAMSGSPAASDASDRSDASQNGVGAYVEAADQILSAFESERSDMWIEAGGTVQRELADDSEGSRHQRFIVRLPNDHTILIAHNIDLAQRVPVKAGDRISFYGEYEWNDRGGVIHWTHHDPKNPRKGGWIRHKDTTYR